LGAAPFGFKGAVFHMRNALRRYYGRGDLHFVTFSCYRRRPLLGTPRARTRFVKILDEVRARFGFRLIGYVVMPEHVHLLFSEPKTANPSKVLQVLKQKVSSTLQQPTKFSLERRSFELYDSGTVGLHFWQRRFYDFNVWSSERVREKLEYMHANPVKRKLVEHPRDWRWSSWSHYENGEEGLIAVDSAIGEEVREGIEVKIRTLETEGCGTHRSFSPQGASVARSKRV
jgi:putative transposase